MHTLADPLHHAERNYRGNLALVCGNTRSNYGEMLARCRKLASALARLGLEQGDRVAILAANSHQYIETYVAAPAAGYVVVPLNTRHADPELLYALEDSGAKVLLTDRELGTLESAVEHVIRIPEEYEALLADAAEIELGSRVTEDTLAGLFYTGGTTGASKGVMLSHRNLIANTLHWITISQPQPQDRFLVMAPLFHATGSNSVLASIWTGGTQVVVPQFAPAEVLDLITHERITQFLGVPTMIAAISEEQSVNPRDIATVRTVAHGGSPVATETIRRATQAFPDAEFIHVYGATETAPLVTVLRHEEQLLESARATSCGQAAMGVMVRILGEDGTEVMPGEVGELAIRGPNVMQGYWNKAEQTKAVLKDGWYYSGDLGRVDEEGYIFLVDRAKDMIVSGGENVYCSEVEEILYKHPAVLQAAVFGIPDKQWGELVHAAVVLRHPVNTQELIAFCKKYIAGYKVPKSIDIWDEPLPQSGPGKILKRQLRAPYWEGQETQLN